MPISGKLITCSRSKNVVCYTLFQTKMLKNRNLSCGMYLYSVYKGVPLREVDACKLASWQVGNLHLLASPFSQDLTLLLSFDFPGNQGWPTVAYNSKSDEYMIAFQFRSGVRTYFNNKYIIISQRVMSSQTERAAGPSLLVKAHGKAGPTQWVDAMNPIITYNSVTGRYAWRTKWFV